MPSCAVTIVMKAMTFQDCSMSAITAMNRHTVITAAIVKGVTGLTIPGLDERMNMKLKILLTPV